MSGDVSTLEKIVFGMDKNVTSSLCETSRANSLLSIYDRSHQISPNRGGPVLGENLGCSLKASNYLTPDYTPNISEHL